MGVVLLSTSLCEVLMHWVMHLIDSIQVCDVTAQPVCAESEIVIALAVDTHIRLAWDTATC